MAGSPLPESGFYSISEAAARIGASRDALYRAAQRHEAPFPVLMVCGRLRARVQDVELFVDPDWVAAP